MRSKRQGPWVLDPWSVALLTVLTLTLLGLSGLLTLKPALWLQPISSVSPGQGVLVGIRCLIFASVWRLLLGFKGKRFFHAYFLLTLLFYLSLLREISFILYVLLFFAFALNFSSHGLRKEFLSGSAKQAGVFDRIIGAALLGILVFGGWREFHHRRIQAPPPPARPGSADYKRMTESWLQRENLFYAQYYAERWLAAEKDDPAQARAALNEIKMRLGQEGPNPR